MTDKQTDALRLADELEDSLESHDGSSLTARCQGIADDAAAELRRQYAEIETLRAGYAAARLEIESLKAQQPGAAYAALPEYGINTASHAHFRVLGFTADQMRAFADATHTLRVAPHGQASAPLILNCKSEQKRLATLGGFVPAQADPLQPVVALQEIAGMYADDFKPQADRQPAPAAVAGPVVNRATVIEWLDANDIEVTDRQMDGLFHFAAPTTQPAPQQEPSCTSVQLAEMVLSDCGHSSNYTPLLERVAARIDAHVERCLESKKTPQQEAQEPMAWHEQARAIREGNEIAASDKYFSARPQIVSADRRKVFQAGFERGWDAARAAQEGKSNDR